MTDTLATIISFCDQRMIAIARKIGFTPAETSSESSSSISAPEQLLIEHMNDLETTIRTAQQIVKLANKAFREKQYLDSFFRYQRLSESLARVMSADSTVAPPHLWDNQNGSTVHVARTNADPNAKQASNETTSEIRVRIAVLLHAYHLGILDETSRYLDNIPAPFDLYVTTPHSLSTPEIEQLGRRFPSAVFLKTPNKGRDVLPFLVNLNRLEGYDLCLKIHTKQGLTNFGDLWRSTALESLLGSKSLVTNLFHLFEQHPSAAIAGPEAFYISGRKHIYGNREAIRSCCKQVDIDYQESREWAFFAGTMFWFKPSLLLAKYQRLPTTGYAAESGKQDGALEHAIERMFGLIPSYAHLDALLIRGSGTAFTIGKTQMPNNVTDDEPTKYLEAYASKLRGAMRLTGDVNKQSTGALADMKIRGWLAVIGSPEARDYTIRIGDYTLNGTASYYRSDLDKAGINQGCHGIEHAVPLRFANGVEHIVSLFDTASGLPIATGKYKWNIPKRLYSTFSQYLAWSYTNQIVNAPFTEEDKRALAMMDVIANDLCRYSQTRPSKEQPVVSIIMPAHNRETTIGAAIESIFAQQYTHWELIVVDDASSDNTLATVESLTRDRPNVKVIQCATNVGVSRARNIGLAESAGEFVAYLDSDNTWDRRYLQAMIGACIKKGFAHDALYCGQLIYSGKQRELTSFRFGHFNKSLLSNNNYIDLNSFIHKRCLISTVGGFDESLKRCVDWEFISRIAARTKLLSIPMVLSNYFLLSVDNTITGNMTLEADVERSRSMVARNLAPVDIEYLGTEVLPISVIIPSYMATDSLKRCLDSLSPLLGRAVAEVILVDNKSDVKTVDVLREFYEQHRTRVKLVLNDHNVGFTLAVNIGIQHSDPANDILLLNNDAVVTSSALNKLYEKLRQRGDIGIVVPGQILAGGTETISNHVPYANPAYDVDVNVSTHHGNLTCLPTLYSGEGFDIDFAPFFCALIRRSVLHQSNNLDASNGRHYRSDRTLCSFVTDVLGMAVHYCPDAIVHHQLQVSTKLLRKSGSTNKEFKYIFEENTWSEDEIRRFKITPAAWTYSSFEEYMALAAISCASDETDSRPIPDQICRMDRLQGATS